MLYILAIIYIIYVSIESFGLIARYSGYHTGKVPIGLSLQNQVYSLNRLIGFFIAPMTGLVVDLGGTDSEIFILGMFGTFFGGIGLVFIFTQWSKLSGMFSCIINNISINGYSIRQLTKTNFKKIDGDIKFKLKFNYFIAQVLTTGLAMPSVFVLNILAIKNPEFKATLLQMATLISGIGNLILNFYTMPLLAVSESNKKEETKCIYMSIFWGKVTGMLLLAPIIIMVAYYV